MSMITAIAYPLLGALLVLASDVTFVAQARAADTAHTNHRIQFSDHDDQAQRIAEALLSKENVEEGEPVSGANPLWTAWVNTSDDRGPALFVMYGCSPTGNCELNGFERTRHGYRLVLDSIAQGFSILPSSHAGHRDLSAFMHGDAFEGTRKTYWWRGGRYVRVSEGVARYPD